MLVELAAAAVRSNTLNDSDNMLTARLSKSHWMQL
jgi:hypothetical protein